MRGVIRLAQLFLLALAIGWAAYATSGLVALAQTFPTTTPHTASLSYALASIQGYAVVFGPSVVAIASLFVRRHGRSIVAKANASDRRS